MSEEIIVHARLREDGIVVQILPDGTEVILESQTDWERVDTMTYEEIEAAALSDPDCSPQLLGRFHYKSFQDTKTFSGGV